MAEYDNADLSKTVYLECECGSFDHTVRFSLWDWNNYSTSERSDPPELCIDYRINHHEYWYERVWSAIKYVFGRGTLEYHDVLVDKKGVDKLHKLCEDYMLAHAVYDMGSKK